VGTIETARKVLFKIELKLIENVIVSYFGNIPYSKSDLILQAPY
jgi:hypothetical protein